MKAGGHFRPCAACGGQINECWGHILYDCPALLEGDPDDEFAALPEQLVEVRDRLVKSGIGAGRPEWDYTYPVYGIPELPIGLPPRASVSSEVLYWGDTEGQWGPKSYTDGSGFGSNVPETRRCGWGLCQLDPDTFLPKRAIFGPLPYLIQTVGRAERYSIRMGLVVHPNHELFVSDLLSLVEEGNTWVDDLQRGSKQHARVWRDIFVAAEKRDKKLPPPAFQWTPAHRDIDEVVLGGASISEIQDWLGNAWAFFSPKLERLNMLLQR